jgi:hypothetical protein
MCACGTTPQHANTEPSPAAHGAPAESQQPSIAATDPEPLGAESVQTEPATASIEPSPPPLVQHAPGRSIAGVSVPKWITPAVGVLGLLVTGTVAYWLGRRTHARVPHTPASA